MSGQEPDLEAIREAITRLDTEFLDLIHRRMEIVEGVAEAKLLRAFPFRDPPREERVLADIRQRAVELGLDPHQIERLYRVILDMSVQRQQGLVRDRDVAPLRVVYQGVEGSYSHLTAQRRYIARGDATLLEGCDSFREAVDAVRTGVSDFALLPIENSTAGSIDAVYDLLAEGEVVITGEEVSSVRHCLLGLPGSSVELLRTVLSHPQGIAQCEAFLLQHTHLEAQPVFDTAGAARRVRDGNDPTVGAIASREAGERFGLTVLQESIQTAQGNATRFIEIAREGTPVAADRPCKTSLLLVLDHQPGSLAAILGELAARQVNLCKIESRPIPARPFVYRFYLDVEGHAAIPPLSDALPLVRDRTAEMRVLGSYPTADPDGSTPSA